MPPPDAEEKMGEDNVYGEQSDESDVRKRDAEH